MALPVSGTEHTYTAQKGEWLFIPVSLPEAKIGGGDFYNLKVELDAHYERTEYTLVNGGVKVRSENTGIFKVLLSVNHVTKSSCAGVEVKQYSDDEIQIHVIE